MKILKKFLERNNKFNQDGFTLMEMVVAVGVLLALSVGGFLAYSGITENAKQAKVEEAVSKTLNAAVMYSADGTTNLDSEGIAKKVENEYRDSQSGNKEKIIVDVEFF